MSEQDRMAGAAQPDWVARHAEHNGLLPKGVVKHSASLCRPDWCGLDPVPWGEPPLRHVLDELCQGTELVTTIRTQDQLLTALDELLDESLHDDTCFINASDTVCGCIIGRIRAILPPCGAVVDKGNGVYWRCLRNAHPASPHLHYYG